MTVEELANRMSPQELTYWFAYYDITNQEQKAQINKSRRR